MKFFNSLSTASVKRTFLAAAVAASCVSAFAAPTFTFDPSKAITPLDGTAITADQIIVSDYANINFIDATHFTESGYLSFASFQLGGQTLGNLGGLNSTYSLYVPFVGSGTLVMGNAGTNLTNTPTFGTFDTLSYSLVGANGTATFGFVGDTPTVTGNAGQVLATGSLQVGSVATLPAGGGAGFAPTANAQVSFLQAVGEQGFFSPQPFYIGGFTSFTNASTTVSATLTGFNITNGGGTLNFAPNAIPEPGTLALVGLGLMGFALRRRKQA